MPKLIVSRFLSVNDMPCLLKLEQRQWDTHQAASASALRQRIDNHPDLYVGSFCARSGDVWASLFMRFFSRRAIHLTWRAAAGPRPGGPVAPAVVTVAHGPAASPVEGAGTGRQGVNP